MRRALLGRTPRPAAHTETYSAKGNRRGGSNLPERVLWSCLNALVVRGSCLGRNFLASSAGQITEELKAEPIGIIFNFRTTTSQNVERFPGGLVFEAHRLLYHSTLGLRVIKQKKKTDCASRKPSRPPQLYMAIVINKDHTYIGP